MNQITQIFILLFSVKSFRKVCLIFLAALLFGCSDNVSNYTEIKREPQIVPDYSGITIPPNIAPLNFTITEKANKYLVRLRSPKGDFINITSSDGNIRIPSKKWKKLLEQSKEKDLSIEVFIKQKGDWLKFQPIINHVAIDSIDNYLVYRLIYTGYEIWHNMGIYQRNLENFDESPIMINEMSEENCMNCHSFSKNNSNTMMFHMRGKLAGTIIYRNGKITKVNTKTDKTFSYGVYPSWHPNGRYVAFSVNSIMQFFHAVSFQKVEVVDTISDLILFDAETNKISNCAAIASKDRFETFPSWSPDGRFLYFCSAKALTSTNYKYKQIHYDLMRIAFDPDTRQFGALDTVVSSAKTGLSISFPRISPDGKFLLFCMSEYGNFTIWKAESDLYMMNLETKEITKPDINSNQTESYHTWSSTGRWIVFSSRRIDGLFTRPYFTYFDRNGNAYKPFILPQKNPGFYQTLLKSYNIPEFVTSRVELNPRIISELNKLKPINATFEDKK
jgi:hypothetical protein